MPQLNLYVDDELMERIRRAADTAELSISRYVAQLVRREIENEWPENFFEEVLGGWQGEPLTRASQGMSEEREALALGR